MREETGYQVLPDSIVAFGEVEEKPGTCQYSENEKQHGYKSVCYTLEEAIQKNQKMIAKEGTNAWNQRGLKMLELIHQKLGLELIGGIDFMEPNVVFEKFKEVKIILKEFDTRDEAVAYLENETKLSVEECSNAYEIIMKIPD